MKYSSRLGFSFLEMLVVLLLIALLASWALPQWHEVYSYEQQKQAIRNVCSALQLSRLLAVQHQDTTYFCLLGPKQQCVRNRATGYKLFYYTQDGQKVVIEQHLFKHHIRLYWQGLASDNRIAFNPWGGSSANGHIKIKGGSNHVPKVLVSHTGRVRLSH